MPNLPNALPDQGSPMARLEVIVRNHPGVMSHVCGLFARRACNVESILCLPMEGGALSRIWLLVRDEPRLAQMIKQVEKLEDVREVRRSEPDREVFERLKQVFLGRAG